MKTVKIEKGHERGRFWRALRPALAVLLTAGLVSAGHAAPQGGVVKAGAAQITGQGTTTLIQQSTQRAIIDWRGFGINADEMVRFMQPSSASATLNRVTGAQVSLLLGRLDANGRILLINPSGIIFGKGAQINVGSLIASTANISNDNFMKGKLIFDQPGKPGAGIVNFGTITAAEGGLVALVAPHVRNDGLIQARLGKVVMGAADTFAIDLYGDGLINLALSDESLAQLRDSNGQPVKSLITQAGTIDVSGGKAVLVTADVAKGMLDSLINMSGAILADSAVQEGGRILLSARGGNVDVSGQLSATGTIGGQIDILGDQVHLFSPAYLDVSGLYGGGILHVGGAYQGSGDTYRAKTTFVDAGTFLQANAQLRGNGGEAVVWSDGSTYFDGAIQARGGLYAGDGGRVEVSGKQTLFFDGSVDAGATYGKTGTLLLDPYDFTIGAMEAGLIDRVLRTGTSTFVSADHNLTVNYAIDGRGRYAGGGLTLLAGNNLNINDYIITNNGAINLYATAGSIYLAPDKAVYAGTAPITVRSGADLYNGAYLTSGTLSLRSTLGSVFINQGVDPSIGNLLIQADAGDVNINQPVVSLSDGNSVTVTAGSDINVDAQVDGRPAYGSNPNGSVTMTAGQDINLRKSILSHIINLTANAGTINAPTMTAGQVTLDVNGVPQGEGLFAGTGPISVTTGGSLSSGIYVTTGPVSIRSTGGDVNVDTKVAEILGNVTITANSGSVNVDQEIANIRSGSNLVIGAGADINQNSVIDALDDTNPLSITPVPGGSVTFTAGNNVNLNRDLVTYNGPVSVTATGGTLNLAWTGTEETGRSRRIQVYDYDPSTGITIGSAPIKVTTGGSLSTGFAPPTTFPWDPAWVDSMDVAAASAYAENYVVDQLKRYVTFSTTGKLSLTSTGGDVTVDAPIPDTTGEIAVTAYDGITINHKVYGNDQPITLTAGAGGIRVNGTNDTYGIPLWGGVSPAIDSGTGPLTMRSVGDVWITTGNGIAVGGKLTIDTDGRIVQGSVNQHWTDTPTEIQLIADGGIDNFSAGYSPYISASSSNGDIRIGVWRPDKLEISAGGSVTTGYFLGDDVTIDAGLDINLSDVYESGSLLLNAGRYANFDVIDAVGVDVTAGSNIDFNGLALTSISPDYNFATIWLSGGDLTATSTGGNITFGSSSEYSAIHIGGGYGLTLDAEGSVGMGILEALGPVSIRAQTGNITLRNDIGPPILYYNPDTHLFYSPYNQALDKATRIYGNKELNDPSFDPTGVGVASLSLWAGGNISMQGAKASGTVTITTGGTLAPAKGIYSGTTDGVSITATGGALEKLSSGDVNHAGPFTFSGTSFGDIALGNQAELLRPFPVLPAVTPGPGLTSPAMPMALTALPANPPNLASVGASSVPEGSSADLVQEQRIEPERATGSATLSEIIPGEEEEEAMAEEEGKSDETEESRSKRRIAREEEKDNVVIDFPGGRGISQTTVTNEIYPTSTIPSAPYSEARSPRTR